VSRKADEPARGIPLSPLCAFFGKVLAELRGSKQPQDGIDVSPFWRKVNAAMAARQERNLRLTKTVVKGGAQ